MSWTSPQLVRMGNPEPPLFGVGLFARRLGHTTLSSHDQYPISATNRQPLVPCRVQGAASSVRGQVETLAVT